mmetsp:Transcript_58280/g.94718  ORF Transcript_58280/g.94718 Transcript_58280/m.94718 type:complete len:253 (+) Transcript_58280:54-812(+)
MFTAVHAACFFIGARIQVAGAKAASEFRSLAAQHLVKRFLNRPLDGPLDALLLGLVFLGPRQMSFRATTEANDLVLGHRMCQGRLEGLDTSSQANVTLFKVHLLIQMQRVHEFLPSVQLHGLEGLNDDFSSRKPRMALDVRCERSVDSAELRDKEIEKEAVHQHHEEDNHDDQQGTFCANLFDGPQVHGPEGQADQGAQDGGRILPFRRVAEVTHLPWHTGDRESEGQNGQEDHAKTEQDLLHGMQAQHTVL